MASNICYHSAAVVLTSLKIATGAMGGWILDVDEPSIDEGATALKLNNSRTLKMSISGALSEAAAEEVRAIDDSGLRHAASELDYYMRCALDDAPLNGLDALCALFYANEFADFLHRAGRPAFWIPIRNPEVIELMRVLDIAPKGTKIGKGDRVWFNYKRKKMSLATATMFLRKDSDLSKALMFSLEAVLTRNDLGFIPYEKVRRYTRD